jgi:hypothetical protein
MYLLYLILRLGMLIEDAMNYPFGFLLKKSCIVWMTNESWGHVTQLEHQVCSWWPLEHPLQKSITNYV